MKEIRILIPNGMVGYGYNSRSFNAGLQRKPDFIANDAGSKDWGPHYLGTGLSPLPRSATKRDLERMLVGARQANIPMIIGSAGGAGGEPHLRWTRQIVEEIAKENDLHFRLGIIHAEQDKAYLKQKLAQDKIRPLGPVPELTAEIIDRSARVVGMMGVEPIIKALELGSDLVLAGRSSDTSLFAAIPVWRGFPHGLAWHLSKLVECGNAIAIPTAAGSAIFATLREDYFLLEPLDKTSKCTTVSVAAHTLYENPSPYYIHEPSGTLDTTQAKYEQVSDQVVKVSGSTFIPAKKYTIKLEGAEMIGWRSISIAGIRDPILIDEIDAYLDSVREAVRTRTYNMGIAQEDYSLSFRVYGKNGVMGPMEPVKKSKSHELCLVIQSIAKTQEVSETTIAMARFHTLHGMFKGKLCTAGCAAFPFSPSDISMGEAYRWGIWHLVEPDDPYEMFPLEIVNV